MDWTTYDPGLLPPPDARLISGNEKIETPVDDRNLVKIDELVQIVKSTVDPTYEWPRELDIHHYHWPAYRYPHTKVEANFNPARFRNLPIHKGLMPRAFHAWLHHITLPPPVPDDEVIMYRNAAWEVASSLFKMTRRNIQWQRRARRRQILIQANPQILKEEFDGSDEIGEEYIQDVFLKNFRGIEYQQQRLARIPPEFRIVEVSDSKNRVAASLGQFVLHGSANLVKAVAA